MDLGGESSFRSFTNRSSPSVPSLSERNTTRDPSGEKTGFLLVPSKVSCLGVVPSATL